MHLATVKARIGDRVTSVLTQTRATEYPAGEENDLPECYAPLSWGWIRLLRTKLRLNAGGRKSREFFHYGEIFVGAGWARGRVHGIK